MFVELELDWIAHPFLKNSFKISSEKQIAAIRELGLAGVRLVPEKSDPVEDVASAGVMPGHAPQAQASGEQHQRWLYRERLALQQRCLLACERRFGEASSLYAQLVDQIESQPLAAATRCFRLVTELVKEMLDDGETAIRLLSERVGSGAAMHPVNVTVMSLLLGKALRLPREEMLDLGAASFLHDIGKSRLSARVRWLEEDFSTVEYRLYQEHVAQGVILGKRMMLSAGALSAIAQHHEMVDGSGFPARLTGKSLSRSARILALVNRYDNLCNPRRLASALTPHDALALIFSQFKARFDSEVLNAFIRMMGVYPPGSVVQLVDDRFAMVVSVNSSRPLKPRVIVHEPGVPQEEALILDLEHAPAIGIRRSLKPASLPKAAADYLLPRQRISYFFEKARESEHTESKL